MAVVDFTLDDVREVIDERFQLFEAKYDDDMSAIQGGLVTIISRLDVAEPRLTSTCRIVDQHSKDIMELRAIVQG